MPKVPERQSLASRLVSMPRPHDNDNPLWAGPCGAGPQGGVTQSMLVRFLSCRERFRLRYVCGLEPPDRWNHHMGYGNMWHVCEEMHAGGIGDWTNHLGQYVWQQQTNYPMQRDEIGKWANVCRVQFPEYVRYWSDHPDVQDRTPLLQEQVFDVPYTLSSGRVVRLRGKFDSVDLIDGGVWLQENKTKGDVDKVQIERQLKFDLQTMLYLIALDQCRGAIATELFGTPDSWERTGDVSILGVRYNVVKRDCPIKQHEGRMLKAGWKPGETTEEWMARLRDNYYAPRPGDYFFRVRSEVSERDVRVFRDTCLDPLLETVCMWYDGIINSRSSRTSLGALNYRTPFGVWSALEEGGATEYDAYLDTGSEAGLRRTEALFTELSDGVDPVGDTVAGGD